MMFKYQHIPISFHCQRAFGEVASRSVCNGKIAGSIPASSSFFFCKNSSKITSFKRNQKSDSFLFLFFPFDFPTLLAPLTTERDLEPLKHEFIVGARVHDPHTLLTPHSPITIALARRHCAHTNATKRAHEHRNGAVRHVARGAIPKAGPAHGRSVVESHTCTGELRFHVDRGVVGHGERVEHAGAALVGVFVQSGVA
jgi:hypothetical protein